MPNAQGYFGLTPVRHIDGTPWNGATTPMSVGATYATALFIGDPVLQTPTLAEKDTTGKRLTINKSGGLAAAIALGAIVSFEPLATDLTKNYNPASTARIANVCVGTDTLLFAIRGSGGGAPDKSFIGLNAVMKAMTAGSTTSGLSGMALDEGDTTAPAVTQNFTLHVWGILEKEDNSLADYACYLVTLNTCKNATGERLGVLAA